MVVRYNSSTTNSIFTIPMLSVRLYTNEALTSTNKTLIVVKVKVHTNTYVNKYL